MHAHDVVQIEVDAASLKDNGSNTDTRNNTTLMAKYILTTGGIFDKRRSVVVHKSEFSNH